ncbi:[acyl-carrier-protein] S-malonyltransferase [Bradyrhizobium sp. LM2.3]
MTLAILCAGQGRQHRDMFALTGDAPEAAQLFGHAAALLGGRDPRDLVRGEADEAMHRNRAGQILCTLQSLAAARALAEVIPHGVIIAGYSVGEVAAWGVGGLFDAITTLDLVARRAEAMDAATRAGDGLIFVRGLSPDAIGRLCVCHGAAIAIVNPGDAFVIGGGREALSGIAIDARAMHAARIVTLPVEVASHTKRLAAASAVFRETLRLAPVVFPPRTGARILSGIDASPVVCLGRERSRQACRTDLAHRAVGRLPASLCRSGCDGISRSGAGTCAEQHGRGNRGRTSGSLSG